MATLLDSADRRDIVRRVNALTAAHTRRWGSMTLERMLGHLADQLRFASKELVPRGPRGPLTWPPIRWLAIVVVPWPHGRLEASAELVQTGPREFEASRAELLRLVERFPSDAAHDQLGSHPMFGRLSTHLWGLLAWRHLDHHLRQFGA